MALGLRSTLSAVADGFAKVIDETPKPIAKAAICGRGGGR